MTSSKYRFLLWQFIAASDLDEYDSVTAETVHDQAEAGKTHSFLTERFGEDLDFSYLEPQDWVSLSAAWKDLALAVDAPRKFGVENRGVSLLMAYALESLQRSEKP